MNRMVSCRCLWSVQVMVVPCTSMLSWPNSHLTNSLSRSPSAGLMLMPCTSSVPSARRDTDTSSPEITMRLGTGESFHKDISGDISTVAVSKPMMSPAPSRLRRWTPANSRLGVHPCHSALMESTATGYSM